jgi:hypothetical protein
MALGLIGDEEAIKRILVAKQTLSKHDTQA